MSEEHDIVLKLDVRQFDQGLEQARIKLREIEDAVRVLGIRMSAALSGFDPSKLNFKVVSDSAKEATTNLKTVETALKNINKTAGEVKKKVVKAFDFGTELGKNLQRGIEIGLSHAVGAISVGANPLTSIPHELIRNVGISVFHTLIQAYKSTGDAAKAATAPIEGATEALNTNAEGAVRSSVALARLTSQTGAIGQFFSIIVDNFLDLAKGTGLLLLGKLLDNIGDKLLGLTESLAKIAGEANLSFIQLNAVIETTSQNLGVNLGVAKEWESFIIQLSTTSGTSRKELADFATAFVQVGADAGLSGEELQKLVTIAAFTKDRFRNATEQLTNFRQALSGNVRFLQNNIPIGTTLNDVTEKYAQALQRAGHSQEEATRIAKESTVAKRVLAALDEASIPFIKTATETTGSYTIELRKLNAAIANLKISLGTGIEGIFAGATKRLREFISNVVNLPQPIQTFIGVMLTTIGVITEVGGELLKLVGYIVLVTTAWKILNAAVFVSIPILGGSVAWWAAIKLSVGGAIPPITSLGALLGVLWTRFVALVKPLSSFSGLMATIGTAFTRLGAFLGPLITKFATLANLLTLLKFGAIITGVIALAEGFSKAFSDLSKINDGAGVTSSLFRGLTDALGLTTGAVDALSESFHISERAAAAWGIAINIATLAAKGLAIVAGIATQSLLEESVAITQHKLINAIKDKDTEAEKKLRIELDQKQKTLQKIANVNDELVNSTRKTVVQTLDFAHAVTATNSELEQLNRALIDSADQAVAFGDKMRNAFSDDQTKLIENAVRGFRRELAGLNAKSAELNFGKAAGRKILDLERAKELARQINESTKNGKGIKLLSDDQIEGAISTQEIFNAIRVNAPELGDEIEAAFKPLGSKEDAVEGLTRQVQLLGETTSLVNNLKDSFNKEFNSLKSTVDLQNQFNDAISQSPAKDNFDALIKKAQLENEIRKATLDVENKIQDVRDRIDKGKIEIQGRQIFRVELNPKEKEKAKAELDKLTKDRDAIINLKINEITAKRTGEIIAELQKQIESLGKFFEDHIVSLQDENGLLQLFNINLSQGTKFAEEQNALATKRLALSNKIVNEEKELIKIDQEIADLGDKATPREKAVLAILRQRKVESIANARASKESADALEETTLAQKNQTDLNTVLVKQKEALQDQLALISIRADLFKEGVLVGEFNKTREQIQAITGELENLFKKKEELERQADQSKDKSLISTKEFDETIKRINDFKEVLKNLNIRETIREALQTIPDELQKAFTTGFREVLAGTKKITDLLRETASNILNNISDIFAKKAFDKIRNGLDEVANQIADSDFFKNISQTLGIDLGKDIKDIFGATKKVGTPTEQLNETTQELNDINKNELIPAIKDNTAALRGQSKPGQKQAGTATEQPGGIIPTTTNLPIGIAAAPPPIDFDVLAQQVTDGTATLEVISETGISGWFEESTKALSSGFQTLTQSGNTGFLGLFSNLGSFLSKGLSSLTSSISGLFSGGGDIFSSILSGIGSIFSFIGFAKGGLIPGQSSTKDDQVRPVASGEYVVNSEAVKAYGPKFFDALNNMSLPQDFFNNLQASGAAAQLASIAPSIGTAIGVSQPTQNERPIIVNVIDRAPKLDPAAFKMKPSEVTQIFVDGIRKDRITRRVIRDDLRNG